MKKNKNFGFTLLEVLVVVAIGGLILSIALATMSNARQRSRDARREQDMKQIQSTLNLYAATIRAFPTCAATSTVVAAGTDCLSVALVGAGAIPKVALDPINAGSGICADGSTDFLYCYQSTNGSVYTLSYKLETNTIKGKIAGWQRVRP